jgi:hypothetical protein
MNTARGSIMNIGRRYRVQLALCFFLLTSIVLVPVTSNPFDLATIVGPSVRWLDWGTPFYLFNKFGLPYQGLVLAEVWLARSISAALHISPVSALHITFKIPLVLGTVACAWLLIRFGRLGFLPHAQIAAAAWLLSPVTIWVAAVHGQMEPLALAFLLGATLLCFREHWFWAGVVAGVGVSILYFPIVAALVPLLGWIRRKVRFKSICLFSVGLGSSVAASFSLTFFFSAAREAVLGGLGASSRGGAELTKPASLWYPLSLVNPRLARAWPALFLLLAILLLIRFARNRDRPWQTDALLLLGYVLIAFVVIYPTSLPQFNVIAVMGLTLLLTHKRVSVWTWLLVPVLSYIGFFFSTSLYQFFWDIDHRVWSEIYQRALYPVIPLNETAFVRISFIAALAFAWVLTGFLRFDRSRRETPKALTQEDEDQGSEGSKKHGSQVAVTWRLVPWLALIPTLAVVVIALQPPFWSHVKSAEPARLAEYDSYINPVNIPIDRDQAGVKPDLSGFLADALLKTSRPGRPTIGLGVLVPSQGSSTGVGTSYSRGRVLLAANRDPEVKVWWLRLLLNSPNWGAKINPRIPQLSINGDPFNAFESDWSNGPGWIVATYRLPATMIPPSGRIDVEAPPGVILNGASNGVLWHVLIPAEADVVVRVGTTTLTRKYRGDISGLGIIASVWDLSRFFADATIAPGQLLSGSQVLNGKLEWGSLDDQIL